MIYLRKQGKFVEDQQDHQVLLTFLYDTKLGRLILAWVIQPFFSKLLSLYYHSPLSKGKISNFIDRFQIDMKLYAEKNYSSFADFFVRKYEENPMNFNEDPLGIYAPCQGLLSLVTVDSQNRFCVKNQLYSLEELLENRITTEDFQGGLALIYRLSLQDYHRYHYAGNGPIVSHHEIKGKLHTIREIALSKFPVYKENQRQFCLIDTMKGPLIQMEVGALTVGKIHNVLETDASIYQEKGYFTFGGSTIIVIYPPETIQLDSDILNYSQQGNEVKVQLGERIGRYL